jgi:hypothetical protein
MITYVSPSNETINKFAHSLCRRMGDLDSSAERDFAAFMQAVARAEAAKRTRQSAGEGL